MAKAVHLRAEKLDSVMGYVIRPASLWNPASRAKYVDLLMELALEKKPIAFLDEMGDFALPQPLSANRLIKVFTIAGHTAGRDIGRLLLSLGHTRVAFISYHQNEAWAAKRFEGLKFEFAKAGYSDAVSLHTMEYSTEFLDMLLDPTGLSPQQMNLIFPGRQDTPPDNERLKKQLSFLDPIIQSNAPILARFRRNIRTLAQMTKSETYGDFLAMMIERSIVNMRRDIFRLFLRPLFKKVLSDTSCTAWVGATDETAVCALDFLKDKKIKVPRDLSIVGFDGDLYGFENGITSYDFDFQNIGRQMIAFLFQPTSRAYFGKKREIEMPGLPVLRDSAGRRAVML